MSGSGGSASQGCDGERLARLEALLLRHGRRPDALVEVLHEAQALWGFLPREVLRRVAQALGLAPSRVLGVASFYHLFRLAPRGAHTCTVCTGTACQVNGAGSLLSRVEAEGGLAVNGTSADGQLSLAAVRCVGACGVAPVVLYDGALAGRQEAAGVLERLAAWRRR